MPDYVAEQMDGTNMYLYLKHGQPKLYEAWSEIDMEEQKRKYNQINEEQRQKDFKQIEGKNLIARMGLKFMQKIRGKRG